MVDPTPQAQQFRLLVGRHLSDLYPSVAVVKATHLPHQLAAVLEAQGQLQANQESMADLGMTGLVAHKSRTYWRVVSTGPPMGPSNITELADKRIQPPDGGASQHTPE